MDALQAEHDENEVREDFTLSERLAIAEAIRERIGDRQGDRTDREGLPAHGPEVQKGEETRTVAARQAGFSSTTEMRRVEAVADQVRDLRARDKAALVHEALTPDEHGRQVKQERLAELTGMDQTSVSHYAAFGHFQVYIAGGNIEPTLQAPSFFQRLDLKAFLRLLSQTESRVGPRARYEDRQQDYERRFREKSDREKWTQERIAKRMGKRQSWVSQRLRFGAFLAFITSGDNPEIPALSGLTERGFRRLWSKTKGDDKARYRQVLPHQLHRPRLDLPHPLARGAGAAGGGAGAGEAAAGGRRFAGRTDQE